MSKPTTKITRTIRSEQVLNAFVEVVRRNLPLQLQNTRITAEDILYVLAYANVHRLSMESACLELQNAPSGNRLREVLAVSLPDRAGLQNRLNRMFRQQLHPSIWKCKRDFNLAIDLTLIPYHGQPYEDKKEIVRSAPKSGTTHFHGYATVSIVRDNQRYVVALHFIEYGEEMAEIVRWLLKRLKSLQFRIRRVFWDKGFCSKPVFKVLDQHKVSFVTPIPVRGKSGGVRTLFQGKSRATTYTFNSPKHGKYTVQAVVLNISEKQADYAAEVAQKLHQAGFRAESDLRNEKITYKIREHSLNRLPYQLVVGDKEKADGLVAVRTRGGQDLGQMSVDDLIRRLQGEVAARSGTA